MLRASADVLSQPVGDELVLMDLATSQYFSLNPVGAQVWRLLQETSDLDEIRRRLTPLYDVDETTLAADVGRIVSDLLAAGLLLRES